MDWASIANFSESTFRDGLTTWIIGAITPSMLGLIFVHYTTIKFELPSPPLQQRHVHIFLHQKTLIKSPLTRTLKSKHL
jgi:hypothetical protein